MKVCSFCKIEKLFTEFYKRSKNAGGRESICISCYKEKQNQKYKDSSEHKLSIRANSKKHRDLARKFLYNFYKTHLCIDCGESDPFVLELDHVRGEKIASVSRLVSGGGGSLQTLQEEIDKCEVRCANCHRKKTAIEQGWYKDLMENDLE